jgi:hypothetical protein
MSSEIVVGAAEGVLEAKMQLELPGGPRIIKCFAGSSLPDLQKALVAVGLMTTGHHLVKVGGPDAPRVQLAPDTALASLNRCKLQIVANASGAATAQVLGPAATAGAAASGSHGKSSPPPTMLHQTVGIDAAELEKRKLQIAEDYRKQEENARRILAAHDQEQKDRSLQKKMIQDKIIADNEKQRNALAAAGAPAHINIGDPSSGAAPSKIRIQTARGGVEVICYDNDATMGTLRMILVGKGLLAQDAPIIQATQQ